VNKLNSGFSRLRHHDLVRKTHGIISALTGNSHFPNPTPALTILRGSLSTFESALTLSKGNARDPEALAARSNLTRQLHRLARNLEMTDGVTDSMLATTGFNIRKRGARTDAPVGAPGNVRLRATGVMGKVQLLCAPVYRAKSYEVHYGKDPGKDRWANAGTFPSTRGITISGLTRGKDYWARIRAIGPKGPGPWSHLATIMAT
jgi:hypothetical protein